MEPTSDIQFLAQMLSKTIRGGADISSEEFARLDEIAVQGHSSVPVNPSTGEAPS